MVEIMIAADSFKGSASSIEVASYIEQGIIRVNKEVKVKKIPIADGGEGTVDAVISALGGEYKEHIVTGPYGQKVKAQYGIINQRIAVIEMAQASGLHLRTQEESIWQATTYGTGELIKLALENGVREIYIGLGGSATNDGGAGMAQALGAKLYKNDGQEIEPGAKELSEVVKVDITSMDERLKETSITLLSDVTNPLTGENGASYIFGTQKGAYPVDIIALDKALTHFGRVVEEQLNGEWMEKEGAGAAGGLGFGLLAFCGAKIESGIDKVLNLIQLEQRIQEADLIITGEGRMDGQSVQGKAPLGVAKMAKKYNLPVIAVVGSADEDLTKIYKSGIDLVIDTVNCPMTLEQAIERAPVLISRAGETAIRSFFLK